MFGVLLYVAGPIHLTNVENMRYIYVQSTMYNVYIVNMYIYAKDKRAIHIDVISFNSFLHFFVFLLRLSSLLTDN